MAVVVIHHGCCWVVVWINFDLVSKGVDPVLVDFVPLGNHIVDVSKICRGDVHEVNT